MNSKSYSSQNSRIWEALRDNLTIQEAPARTPLPDLERIQLNYDVGQGGYAKLTSYHFDSGAISINAANLIYIVETSTAAQEYGVQPDVDKVSKLTHCWVRAAGGTVSPLRVLFELLDPAGSVFTCEEVSLVNPGVALLPRALLGIPSMRMDVQITAGGAGDTAQVMGQVIYGVPGKEIP